MGERASTQQTRHLTSTQTGFLQAIYFIKAGAQGKLSKGDNFVFPVPWKLKFFPKHNLLCSLRKLRREKRGSEESKE